MPGGQSRPAVQLDRIPDQPLQQARVLKRTGALPRVTPRPRAGRDHHRRALGRLHSECWSAEHKHRVDPSKSGREAGCRTAGSGLSSCLFSRCCRIPRWHCCLDRVRNASGIVTRCNRKECFLLYHSGVCPFQGCASWKGLRDGKNRGSWLRRIVFLFPSLKYRFCEQQLFPGTVDFQFAALNQEVHRVFVIVFIGFPNDVIRIDHRS